MPSAPVEGFGLFVLLSLSVYRTWRFIGKDDLTARLRLRLPSFIAKPVSCPWCLGFWLSIAATYATHRWVIRLGPHWLLWAVACSCVVGLIGEKLDNE